MNTILNKTKKALHAKTYDFIPTTKNRLAKRKYGLTTYDIEDFISTLDTTDLHRGPLIDRDYIEDELFIFKKEIKKNVVFYIKLKEKNNQIIILSCHEDEI